MSDDIQTHEADEVPSSMCDYARLERRMRETELDALISTGHANAMYLTGYVDVERWARDPQDLAILIVVMAFPDKSFVVGGFGERLGFEGAVYDCDYTLDARLAAVAEQIRARGLHRSRIGIDANCTPASSLQKLQNLLPEAQFETADVLLTQMRSAKTRKEVEYIQQAVSISEDALRSALKAFRFTAGVTYADLIIAWAKGVLDRGAFPVATFPYDIVAQHTPSFGMRTRTLYRYPKHFEPGLTTRLDLVACYRGYYSDQKFVLCLGEPSVEAQKAFRAHRARQELMREVIRPGVTKEQVYRTCLEKFTVGSEYQSVEEFNFWIHGVGLDIHEEPMVGSKFPLGAKIMPEITFEVNTVLALEPSWLVEDTYIVEETGVRCLGSNMTHEIITL